MTDNTDYEAVAMSDDLVIECADGPWTFPARHYCLPEEATSLGAKMTAPRLEYIREDIAQALVAEAENTLPLADDQRREWEHHCKAAEAERDALMEALETIARGKYDGLEVTRLNVVECRIIAIKALTEKGKDQ